MSFINQARAVEFPSERADGLEPGVHGVPAELDRKVASLKPAGMGIEIDELTSRQERYLGSWHLGT